MSKGDMVPNRQYEVIKSAKQRITGGRGDCGDTTEPWLRQEAVGALPPQASLKA